MFKMLPPEVVNEFRRQREQGIIEPSGAFDVMTRPLRRALARDAALTAQKVGAEKPAIAEGALPSSMQKQLSALTPGARDQLRRYLSKDQLPAPAMAEPPPMGGTPMDQEPDEEEEGGGGLTDRVCSLLEEYGLPDEVIDKVRALGSDDLAVHQPDVHIHKDDGPVVTKKAFDKRRRMGRDAEYGAGSSAGSSAYPGSASPNSSARDQGPPPFPGMPEAGGGQVPMPGPLQATGDENRRIAMDYARRIRVDGPSAASLERDRRERVRAAATRDRLKPDFGLLMRFPEAARLLKG
jgi:hypothetical protein